MAPIGAEEFLGAADSLLSSVTAWWGLRRTGVRLGRIRIPHPVCLCMLHIETAVLRWFQRTYPIVQIRPVGDSRLRRDIKWEA